MPKVNVRKRTYKSGKTVYYYYFEGSRVAGKRNRITESGFKTKREAEEAGKKALNAYENAGNVVKSNISFADVIDEWQNGELKQTTTLSTQEGYGKRIKKHIKPELGKFKLASITTPAINEFLYKLYDNGFSRNTIISIKGIISRVFDYAISARYIANNQNPMIGVKLPNYRNPPKKETRKLEHVFINNDDIKKIFQRFPEGHPAFLPLALCYHLGLRKGEAFGLAWEDIDFENKIAHVVRQVQYDGISKCWCCRPVKYGRPREVSINDDLLETLKRIREDQIRRANERKHSYKIFLSNYPSNPNLSFNSPIELSGIKSKGMRQIEFLCIRDDGSYIVPNSTMHASRVIHNNLGIKDFTYHSLRHTHGSLFYKQCHDLTYVAKRLGHKNTIITAKYYLHSTDCDHSEEQRIINEIQKEEAIPV